MQGTTKAQRTHSIAPLTSISMLTTKLTKLLNWATMTAYMQSQPPSKCIYNKFKQCRTILERNRASLVTAERTSAFEEDTNLFMNP